MALGNDRSCSNAALLFGTIGGVLLVSCSSPPRTPTTTPPDPLPTCLVLSVGDTKGIAHIGVIHALREKGVKIDCVVGTSMGALVGGLYAAHPEEDPALGYRELFQLYEREKREEGTGRSLFGAMAGGTLAALSGGAGAVIALSALGGGAAAATTTRVQDWDTLHEALLLKLGEKRIESLDVRYVTQYRRVSDATSTTVKGGILADEIARSVKNPLLFPHLTADENSTLDPGLDELSAVPINVACREFPGHQLIVSNVTGEKAKVLAENDCPYQEILIPLVDHERPRAIRGRDPDYSELIFAGHEAAQALDWSTFPISERAKITPIEMTRAHVSVQLDPEKPGGGDWDVVGGAPDPILGVLVARCESCDGYGTSVGSSFHVAGPSGSLQFTQELGILRLRPGFQLGVVLVDEDVTKDDPVGSGVLIYDPEKPTQSLAFDGGSVTVEFGPARSSSRLSAN